MMDRANERSGGVFSSYNSRKPQNPTPRTIPSKPPQRQQQQQQQRWTPGSSSSSSQIPSLAISKENGIEQTQAIDHEHSSNPLPPPSTSTTTTTNNTNNTNNTMRMVPAAATPINPSSYSNGVNGVHREGRGGMDLSADTMILDLITKYV